MRPGGRWPTCEGEIAMLDLHFAYPGVLRRLRGGALGGEVGRIAAHLSTIGYTRCGLMFFALGKNAVK